ncbi:MAG: DUF429 domain-containing protein [Acidobacteriota bacterium]
MSPDQPQRPMKVYGVDFSSAPSASKPITCFGFQLSGGLLHSPSLLCWQDLNQFAAFLNSEGPWIAALDFPFGLPSSFVQSLGWLRQWESYVEHIGNLTLVEFMGLVDRYRCSRSRGAKQPLRTTDRQCQALSPLMIHGIPVGRMFFEGAPRLLRSGVDVVPCRRTSHNRVAVEGYPALVARRLIGRRSYKKGRAKLTPFELRSNRQVLLDALVGNRLEPIYGVRLSLEALHAERAVLDPSGDVLDSLLCAFQAAWAFARRDRNFGVSRDCDETEGWIVDPAGCSDADADA